MRHLMKHHHSSVCQVLQLLPQLPITFPILVRHLAEAFDIWHLTWINRNNILLVKSGWKFLKAYLSIYNDIIINGHWIWDIHPEKQAEAVYNPGKDTHSTHLHDLVLALESADVLLVEDRDELRQPPRDLCCAEKRSFISLISNAFPQNMEKATCNLWKIRWHLYILQLHI